MNQNLLLIFGLLVLGVLLRRIKALPKNASLSFNAFIIYLSFPAVILLQVPKIEMNLDLINVAVTPWVALILSIVLVLLTGKLLKFSRSTIGALLMVIPLGNTSFLGIPIVEGFFGKEGIPYAVLYDQFGSSIALSSYGTFIVSFYAGRGEFSVKQLLKKFLTFPPFIALILALAFKGHSYPAPLTTLLEMLGATLVPLAMIAVGHQLTISLPRSSYVALGSGLTLKLLIIPFLILLLSKSLGVHSFPMKVAVIEAGMSPMITAGAVAIAADLESELVASLVGLGVVASLVTLPFLYTFV